MFRAVPSQVDFPALEKEVLAFWKERQAFAKRVALNKGNPRWSFVDGPITANNPMGVHHAWGRTYKDLWHRYKAMKGYETRYQNGFDCQGLWVEVEVERDAGFKSKRDIEAFGLAPFVVLCKQRVLNFAALMTEQSMRLGMWMDWDDPDRLRWLAEKLGEDPYEEITVEGPSGPVTGTVEQIVGRLGMPELGGSYYTLSDENNYQIWLFLKRCYDRGLVYKGHDVMPWCPRCGTGISEHEIATEGYREITHPGLTVRFPLLDRPGEALLVWTTTPWTLTANVAVAVHPSRTYLRIRQGEHRLYLAKARLSELEGKYKIEEELPGKALEGWRYAGPFDELPAQEGIEHRVLLWDEVSEDEGTGVVHLAPGAGREDFALSKEHGLPVLAPLDELGTYLEGFGEFTGKPVGEVEEALFESLRAKGILYRLEDYRHRYPVCWRCQSELVFRLVDEWFISMDEVREEIMEVTRQIRWIPEFGLERELDWLRNMDDWMISKKRYWGLALPIYECPECGHFDVLGGEEELKERAVDGWDEYQGHSPHRPWVDAVKIACSNCGATTSRIRDVGNPWLDAGIVPYSTMGYRTDRESWEVWFPADFITESFPGQFRTWFYSLLVMSTVLENRPPFLTCFGYASLQGEDGREMHKSLGNAIEFNKGADAIGVDVMRWIYAAHKPENNLRFGYGLADEVRRRFLIPLWNVHSFFLTYAEIDGWLPTEETERAPKSPLDRWILSRLQGTIAAVTRSLDDYASRPATAALELFLDDLSNWYLRRSRRRFWKSERDEDKAAAYATLYRCLTDLIRLLAPFIPFVTERIYQDLVPSVNGDAPESVHHTEFPTPDGTLVDHQLMEEVAVVRRVASLGHAARNQAGIKLRQPIAQVIVGTADPAERAKIEAHKETLIDEMNTGVMSIEGYVVGGTSYRVRPRAEILGPKYGSLLSKIEAALSRDSEKIGKRLQAGNSVSIRIGDRDITLAPEEVGVSLVPPPGMSLASDRGLVVALDTHLTDTLKRAGLAREVVRAIQNLRKETGFQISDRIRVRYRAEEDVTKAISEHSEFIRQEVLAEELRPTKPDDPDPTATVMLDKEARLSVKLDVEKA